MSSHDDDRPALATDPDCPIQQVRGSHFWGGDTRRACDNREVSAFIFNVTFDCVDPRSLARFWSEVTGYELVEARDDFARLHAPDHRGVRHLLFFRVAEPKTAKNRMHVDLASRDADTEIQRLVALGASLVDGDPPTWRTGNGTRWVVLQDPEGNEFCFG
jgi:predicted enzyme related to lactoylglutathione lyase